MNIYDCFMYFDEDLLLEIRLNTLFDYVDKFIIVDGRKAFKIFNTRLIDFQIRDVQINMRFPVQFH
mgnify:CR=1 FL=1